MSASVSKGHGPRRAHAFTQWSECRRLTSQRTHPPSPLTQATGTYRGARPDNVWVHKEEDTQFKHREPVGHVTQRNTPKHTNRLPQRSTNEHIFMQTPTRYDQPDGTDTTPCGHQPDKTNKTERTQLHADTGRIGLARRIGRNQMEIVPKGMNPPYPTSKTPSPQCLPTRQPGEPTRWGPRKTHEPPDTRTHNLACSLHDGLPLPDGPNIRRRHRRE